MSKTEKIPSVDADGQQSDWQQVERLVKELQTLALAPVAVEDFYQQLLAGCVTLLAAEAGAVWLPVGRGGWRVGGRVNVETVQDGETLNDAERLLLVQSAAASEESLVVLPRSLGPGGAENTSDSIIVMTAVQGESDVNAQAVIELAMRPGSSPEVQRGWQELLTTVAQIAADFHLHEQLRTLRAERGFYDQSLALTRRFQQMTDVRSTAFEIANEGRRFVGCDRLSVLVRRGKKWELLAASGVDRIEARADVTKRLQMLAVATAAWGEPLDYADAVQEDLHELPPELTTLIEQHVDESQARRLVAVPITLVSENEQGEADKKKTRSTPGQAVLIAEQFTSDEGEFSRQRIVELAALCEPALRQALLLDRFPVRTGLRWADRWTGLRENWGLVKLTVGAVAALAAVLSLVLVQCDFEVEAPATLRPLVERDVFATATGRVIDVRIVHGQQVVEGEVLAVLEDPQLLLDAERVAGEIATTQKRLEVIAVARTDRQLRVETTSEKLPLSAEAEQLKRQLTSLRNQQKILERRREALTLRSPIAGTVLTLDVQNVLRTRPVERGQILLTVADLSAGWRLLAQMPQDRIGHVVAAQQEPHQKNGVNLAARFRLAGDLEQTYSGTVESISTAAVLDTSGLDQPSPEFEIKIQVDENALQNARPGMNAQVRIACGRRSLGYVWLHDIWDTVYAWLVF